MASSNKINKFDNKKLIYFHRKLNLIKRKTSRFFLDCFELKIPSYLFEEHNAEKWCENKFDGVLLQNTLKYRSRRYHE